MNSLKDIQIKKSIPKETNYFLNDGGGLSLFIKTNGTKQWIFKYTSPVTKKQRKTSFKTYPKMTLLNARAKRDEYLDLLAQGIDPISQAQEDKQEITNQEKAIFQNVAYEWLEKEKLKLAFVSYKKKMQMLDKYLMPYFQKKHLQDIKTKKIIQLLEKKQDTRETAERLFRMLKNIFTYARLREYHNINPLADISPLDILPPHQAKHHPKITDPKILKKLRDSIYSYSGDISIKNALKLVLHIPLRANNLCKLQWSYINFEKKCLTIPRAETKNSDINLDDFQVPLTDEVINILTEQKAYTDHQNFIFLGIDNKKPIHNESPNRALMKLGFNDETKGEKIRLHGFRGTFRSLIDTLDTQNKFSFDLKERALDHHEKNQVVRAYNHRANYFEQLKPLFNFWSDFIMSLKDGVIK